MADIKIAYAASSNLTVTNLNGLPTSSTYVAGWESAAIDNTTNKYLDYRITAKIRVAAASLTAAQIRMYLVGPLDDSTWPDVFDGTESTETVTSAQIRDAICRLGAVTETDTTGSRDYYLDCPSVAAVFGGVVPKKFVIFIAHATGQNLAGSGNNQVTIRGAYLTSA